MEEIKSKQKTDDWIRRILIVCVISIVALFVSSVTLPAFGIETDNAAMDKILITLASITTTAFGYLFGKSADKK